MKKMILIICILIFSACSSTDEKRDNTGHISDKSSLSCYDALTHAGSDFGIGITIKRTGKVLTAELIKMGFVGVSIKKLSVIQEENKKKPDPIILYRFKGKGFSLVVYSKSKRVGSYISFLGHLKMKTKKKVKFMSHPKGTNEIDEPMVCNFYL